MTRDTIGQVATAGGEFWRRFKHGLEAKVLSVRSRTPSAARRRQVYSIAVIEGESLADLRPAHGPLNPVLTRQDVTDAAAVYLADPFMLRSAEKWYMFFEVVTRDANGNDFGQIGLASSADGYRWRYERVILREPFHLSYPYVFEWDGEYYMVPESYQARAVRLYKAVDFPTTWRFEETLLTGDEYIDPSPFHARGTWWMFTSGGRPPMRANMLRLHQAPRVRGPWTEHPRSPIYRDNPRLARSAGRVVMTRDRIVRFAQECVSSYGTLVRAIEVSELTDTAYSERSLSDVPLLAGSGEGWNADGMHHIDPHRLVNGRWFACVDGWTWDDKAA